MTTAKKAGFIGLWLKNCYLMGGVGGSLQGEFLMRKFSNGGGITNRFLKYCRFNIHDLHLMHNTSPILPQ